MSILYIYHYVFESSLSLFVALRAEKQLSRLILDTLQKIFSWFSTTTIINKYIWLVVWTPLKNMKVNWDDLKPNSHGTIKLMFQTTNQITIALHPRLPRLLLAQWVKSSTSPTHRRQVALTTRKYVDSWSAWSNQLPSGKLKQLWKMVIYSWIT